MQPRILTPCMHTVHVNTDMVNGNPTTTAKIDLTNTFADILLAEIDKKDLMVR